MHFYKKHLGDYSKKTGHLSILEHGIYNLIIDAYYDRERGPTLEEAIKWSRSKTRNEKLATANILTEFFTKNPDGTFTQSRIEKEIADYKAISTINSNIAKEREENKRARSVNDAYTTRERRVQEREPNHKPLTTNHKPQAIIKESRDKLRATRFSLDSLPDDWGGFAAKERPQLDARKTFERFGDYWRAKAGSGAAKLDWFATWRNWVRNEKGENYEKSIENLNGHVSAARQREIENRNVLARYLAKNTTDNGDSGEVSGNPDDAHPVDRTD